GPQPDLQFLSAPCVRSARRRARRPRQGGQRLRLQLILLRAVRFAGHRRGLLSMKHAIAAPLLTAAILAMAPPPGAAAVLPDDRADVLYHRYDGGGVTIDGPSLLVRKKLKEKF